MESRGSCCCRWNITAVATSSAKSVHPDRTHCCLRLRPVGHPQLIPGTHHRLAARLLDSYSDSLERLKLLAPVFCWGGATVAWIMVPRGCFGPGVGGMLTFIWYTISSIGVVPYCGTVECRVHVVLLVIAAENLQQSWISPPCLPQPFPGSSHHSRYSTNHL